MTWIALLLADPSPILRLQVLRSLLDRPESDDEVMELRQLAPADPLVQNILREQQPDGSWSRNASGDTAASTAILVTALALMRLGYFGLDAAEPAIRRGAEYLFAQQSADGSWPLPVLREQETVGGETAGRGDARTATGGQGANNKGAARYESYTMVPLQTALPLRGLAACGYAADPRSERAYDWLLARRLPDGAWPTGLAAGGAMGYVAGYRKMPHSRWGCRSNTTAALVCLALHPARRHGDEAKRALDLLLGRETRDEYALGFEVARLVGAEPAHGFFTFHARFDLALLLRLCGRIGVSADDSRLAELTAFIKSLQGSCGLWNYSRYPQVARWLTYDLLQSLTMLENGAGQENWVSLEPPTPFRAYPRKMNRY